MTQISGGRSRWKRFTLRSPLVGIAIVGLGVAWADSRIDYYCLQWEREHEVVQSILEAGGSVQTRPRGPILLRKLAGKRAVNGADLPQ